MATEIEIAAWWYHNRMRKAGGLTLPTFADPVGGALQHLFNTSKSLPAVGSDGYTYVQDKANTGTDRDPRAGAAKAYDGVNGKTVIGNVGNTQYISFWINQPTDNQVILSLAQSTATAVSVVAGVLTFGGSITVNNIYIDGVSKTAAEAGVLLNDNTDHFVWIEYNQIATSNLTLAYDGTTYGNVNLWGLRVGDAVESLADVNLQYDNPTYLHDTESGIWHLDEESGVLSFNSAANSNTPDYISDFSTDIDGWKQVNGSLSVSGGYLICTATGIIVRCTFPGFSTGKLYSISYEIFIPSSNTTCDGFDVEINGITQVTHRSISLDTWHQYNDVTQWTAGTSLFFEMRDGSSTLVTVGDEIRVRNVTLTPVNNGLDSGGVTHTTQNTVTFPNVYGYSEKDSYSNVIIPAQLDSDPPTLDVFGEALTYSGRAPKNGRLVNSACVTMDGIGDKITAAHLTGSETVVSSGGTSTPTVGVGEITFTAGTCWDLVLSDGTEYPLAEGAGLIAYDASGNGNHAQIIGTEAAIWG